MPRCACASEIYGSVFVSVCVDCYRCSTKTLAIGSDKRAAKLHLAVQQQPLLLLDKTNTPIYRLRTFF